MVWIINLKLGLLTLSDPLTRFLNAQKFEVDRAFCGLPIYRTIQIFWCLFETLLQFKLERFNPIV